MRVRSPGAVVTTDEYRLWEPTSGAEIAIDRSMPACCPTDVDRSAGVMRVAIARDDRQPMDPVAIRLPDLPRYPLLDRPSHVRRVRVVGREDDVTALQVRLHGGVAQIKEDLA